MMQFHAVLIRILAADSVKKIAVAVIRTWDRQDCNCTTVIARLLMTTCNYSLQLQPADDVINHCRNPSE